MQNIVFYVAANEPLGAVKDYANAKTSPAPTLVLGAACQLRMRLFATADGPDAYPISEFASITSWQWQMDTDFNAATARKIEADNSDIAVASVTVEIDGEDYTYTEITIPISNMLTEELVAMMNGKESASIAGELCGFDGTGALVFILQVKGFTVRGRISDTGTPTELPVEYLTAAQVRALVNSGFEVVFCESASTTPADWHSTQTSADRYLKFRLAGDASSAWSSIVGMVVGPPGQDGTSCYTYVAYASDDEGTGWSMTPSDALPYRAEIHPDGEIETPTAADFDDAVWVKYLGDDFEDTSFLTFDSVSASNTVTLATACKPVSLRSGITGKYYPVEKGSVTLGDGAFTLDLTPYLAYDNAATFSGTWTVFMAAGLPGEQQDGNEIITLTGTAITPAPNVVYEKTLSEGDAFTIDTSGLAATRQMVFYLYLEQPTSGVNFTFPSSLLWPKGDKYDPTANPPVSPPSMSEGGEKYFVVIFWDGENLLANLAFPKVVQV